MTLLVRVVKGLSLIVYLVILLLMIFYCSSPMLFLVNFCDSKNMFVIIDPSNDFFDDAMCVLLYFLSKDND